MSTDKDIIKGIDAFVSATTGAGVAGRDKFTSYGFQSGVNLDNTTLENLYTDNDLAAIIVERIVTHSGPATSLTGKVPPMSSAVT